jgi:hypothetical protein
MATKFTVGNYYKNETRNREIVVLVESRTKCFLSYKKYWISDLANDEYCTEGKIKIRIDEEGGEYILLDGYDKYKSSNNYEYVEVKEVKEVVKEVKEVKEVVKEVKAEVKAEVKGEYYSSIHKNFLAVGQKFRYVDLKNDVFQDIVFEDANSSAVLNFRAVDENGNKFSCEGSLFVVTEYNQKCLKPFTNNIAIATEEVKGFKHLDEEVKTGELLEDDCDLPEEEEEIKRIRPLTFNEVKTLAGNNGYELEPLLGMFRLIKNNKILTFSNLKRCKDFITLPEEEEIKIREESNEAIKILVKYDFTAKNLTQFESFALTSLKKYVSDGIKPKLLKSFAETLIRKLSPEEKHELRDKALGKVFKGDRLDEIKNFYDVNDKKQKLKQQLRLMDDETFVRLCKDAGVKVNNFHEASLKWIEFINKTEVPEKWEESWEEFKESEEFEKLI